MVVVVVWVVVFIYFVYAVDYVCVVWFCIVRFCVGFEFCGVDVGVVDVGICFCLWSIWSLFVLCIIVRICLNFLFGMRLIFRLMSRVVDVS